VSEARLRAFVEGFREAVGLDCQRRFDSFPVDLYDTDLHEVARGLLARQGSLLIELAKSPGTWNGHVAPLFHRAMSDVQITLAYILKEDQANRARNYILAGLSEEKLQIAHLERSGVESGTSDVLETLIADRKRWLASQRFEHLTIVNAGGSTFGVNTREMAFATGNADLYDFNFTPFSACVHSMWHHVARYNLSRCDNPLHGGHRNPVLSELESSAHELWIGTKTFCGSLSLLDGFTGVAHSFEARNCFDTVGGEAAQSESES
jgi:hypothetical protein